MNSCYAFHQVTGRRGQGRRILLVAQKHMMALYIGLTYDLLKDDGRLSFNLTAWRESPGYPAQPRLLAQQLGVPFVGFDVARLRHWDLIIFADHGSAFRFHPRQPKLRIQHGIACGAVPKTFQQEE